MVISGLISRFRNRLGSAPETGHVAEGDLDRMLEASLKPDEHGENPYRESARPDRAVLEFARQHSAISFLLQDSRLEVNTLTDHQKAFAVAFIRELAAVSGSRGTVLTPDVLEHLAQSLEADQPIAFWQEVWTVPFKIRRRSAVDLLEHVLDEVERLVPYEHLSERGMWRRWAASHAELRSRMRADALQGCFMLDALRGALMKVALRDERTDVLRICHALDYAMSCAGHRESMLRLSETIRRISVPSPSAEAWQATEVRREELAELADAWRRLSCVVRVEPMGDGEEELAELLGPARLDMRALDDFFAARSGWLLPPHNKAPIRTGAPVGDWSVGFYPMRARNAVEEAGRTEAADDLSTDLSPERVIAIMARLVGQGPHPETEDEPMDKLLANLLEAFDEIRNRPALSNERENILAVVAAFASVGFSETTSPFRVRDADPDAGSPVTIDRYAAKTEEPPAPKAEMKILSGIGLSEDTNRTSSEATFGRLLAPFILEPAASGPDEIYLALQAEFPWMNEANELVALETARSRRTASRAFKIAPMLLNGPAGVGKTRWIRRVSELSGVRTHSVSMSGTNTTKQVVGSERGWSNARPSLPAYAFMATEIANPIIYVDEIDKSSQWVQIEDAFLPMLERETARSYHDVYLLGHFDLTAASFLFSANDLSKLSTEFLSRVRPVSVRRPNARELDRVIDAIVTEEAAAAALSSEETERVRGGMVARSNEIFLQTGSLREIQQFVSKEAGRTLWRPPGPRLVET